ncbi:MAG: DUF362 domain-containing protein, partial [Asgard group archaeon]|nr:DUF362 domain-containing protein [Asgard group archaeon]
MIIILEDIKELKNQLHKWLEKKDLIEQMENKRVLLKPNMGYPKPAPYTTSTEIIREVVEVFSELNAKQIMIG